MRVGLFGSMILLILTIIFSYIAIQNNKIAKAVVVKEFALDKNESNKSKTNDFDANFKKELSDFDKKFNSF